MALTDAQYQALIITELGDTSDGLLAATIATLWEKHADAATAAQRYLRAKLDAIDLLLGAARQQVSFRALDGASVDLSDMFKHLLALRSVVLAQMDIAHYHAFSHTPRRVDGYAVAANDEETI